MNCTEFNAKLDDYLDDALNGAERRAAGEHLANCTSCRSTLAEANALSASLRGLPVPPPSDGFEQQVFAKARATHRGGHRRAFMAGFGSALVASLALVYVLVGQIDRPSAPGALPMLQVALHETRSVDLVFNLPSALQGATLSMELPAAFEVKGYPGTHVLTWQANLAAGRNVLTLPVTAVSGGEGELVARIRVGDQEKSFRVKLQTAKGGLSLRTTADKVMS